MELQLSERLATTLRPLGTIPYASNEWPEARNFTRIYARNPFVQSYLMETMLGLYHDALSEELPVESQELSSPFHPPEKTLALHGIARCLWYFDMEHSEWRKKNFDIDRYFDIQEGGHYDADAIMLDGVMGIQSGTVDKRSEQRVDDFRRVHDNNPFAVSNLLRTLVGMYKKPWERFNDRGHYVPEASLERSAQGIAQTIWHVAARYPAWSIDEFEVTKSQIENANQTTYRLENRLMHQIRRVILPANKIDEVIPQHLLFAD